MQTMMNVLNYLKVQKVDFAKVNISSFFFSKISTNLTMT
jgi:hypothetical protein